MTEPLTPIAIHTEEGDEIHVRPAATAGLIALLVRDGAQDSAYALLTPAQARQVAAGLLAFADATDKGGQ